MRKVSDQIIAEIEKKADEINRVGFGDLVFRIQNGKVTMWDVKMTFKTETGQKNWKSERNNA